MGPDGMPTKEWKGELFTAQYPKEKMLEAILTSDVTVNGKTMKATAALDGLGSPILLVEPGRSIVSDSGITLARVAFDKKIAGVHDLISLDLGVVNYSEAIVALPPGIGRSRPSRSAATPSRSKRSFPAIFAFPPTCCRG